MDEIISQILPDVIILSAIGLAELFFALYLFVRYRRTPSLLFFSAFAFCVSGWVLTNGIGLLFARGSLPEEIIYRFAFIFVAFMFPFLYLYILSHPFPIEGISRRLVVSFLTPPVLIALLVLFSRSLIIDFEPSPYAWPVYGSDFWLYAVYVIGMYLTVLIQIQTRIPSLDGSHRWQMRIMFISLFIAGVIGFAFNLVLPYFYELRFSGLIGPASSVIWLSMMGWILIKQK